MFSRPLLSTHRLVYYKSLRAATKRQFNTKNLLSRDNIPFYGTLVGLTALSFQIAVLYPWHHELTVQFAKVEDSVEQLGILSKQLETKLDTVMQLEEQVKAKERKILDRGEEMLALELKVLEKIEELDSRATTTPNSANRSSSDV